MSQAENYTYLHDRPVLQERHRPAFESLSREEAWRTYTRLSEAGRLNKSVVPTDGGSLFLACRMAGLDHGGVVLSLCRERDLVGVTAIEKLIGKKIDVGVRPTAATTSTQRKMASGTPARGPRPDKPTDNLVVRNVVPNPKKPGSAAHIRFAHWEAGLTVRQCLDRGLTRGDVDWDTGHNFVTLCTREEWDRLCAGENIHQDPKEGSNGV